MWYLVAADNTATLRPIKPQNTLVPLVVTPPTVAPPVTPPQAALPQAALSNPSGTTQTLRAPRRKAKSASPQLALPQSERPGTSNNNALHIEQQTEAVDPLLNDAYLAYRGGKFEQAQQLYRQATAPRRWPACGARSTSTRCAASRPTCRSTGSRSATPTSSPAPTTPASSAASTTR